ncbi:hypothetical protein ETAA8_66410 [Anatilimnocola aggregata]|uniref:Carboxypeptidase regulatory-like domain-containing protein n=1 Tax=Anatilimnocola aggregata TaxID=2528021 RepID=A0A517YMN8_9BACT|nr:hypothetical protein [Anatilimnocola aggregata]QDU31483.1 hypothetical protein ETAA8_66410 [Anatilimnocola aggregata]
MDRVFRAWLAVASLTTLFGFAGCSGGGDGPARFRSSGSVTIDGQPVSQGMVYFMPAAGNEGPQGYATIQGGKYDTNRDGGGTVGGMHRIKIVAPDFEYESSGDIDLPKSDGTQNFELKAIDVRRIVPGPPA